MFINKWLLAATLIFIQSTVAYATNYRPYISTTLAKIITAKGAVPDDKVELCDGSGWITHGDGHRTRCPGCKACKDRLEQICKCDTDTTYCDCINVHGKCYCKPKEAEQEAPVDFDVSLGDAKYFICHMGAKWCTPCQKMIDGVWKTDEVRAKMKKIKSKLFIMDASDEKTKKYFDFFDIDIYPTILIIKPDDLRNPIQRIEGGKDKEHILRLLDKLE